MIDYEDLIPRLVTFRAEIATALAESDLELLTISHILIEKGITTRKKQIVYAEAR